MHDIGPYQMFSPIHLAYLERCDAHGLPIVLTDLDSIELANPAAASEPLFMEYRRPEAAGLLRSRPGRKPPTFGTYARLWFAKREIEDEVKAIWARRRAGTETRLYNSEGPGLQAASRIAWEYGFNCTGATLRARISKERIL